MVTASDVLAVDGDESIRIRVRQRPDENRVRRRQNRRGDADAERGTQHGRDCEAGCSAQRSETDARITPDIAPTFGARAAPQHPLVDANGLVAHGTRVPEFSGGAAARIIRRHAARHEIGHAFCEVKGDLVVDVTLRIATPELEIPQPALAHAGCSSALSTL